MEQSKKINIDPPEGLDAEFSGISHTTIDMSDKEEWNRIFNSILSTSSFTLGELLEERKNQVKEIEKIMIELEKYLKDNNMKGDDCTIFFQID